MFKKSLNIILAFLILSISSGVTLNLHYCKDHLQKIALFTTPKSCHQAVKSCCASKQQKACHRDDHDDNCCKNESQFVKYNEQYTVQHEAQLDVKLPLVAVIPFLIFDATTISDGHQTDYLNYKPPLIFEDIPVLFQSFLC